MLDYIYGKVVKTDLNSITLDLRGIGFKIYVPNTSFYKLNSETSIYTYLQIKEDSFALFGFKDKIEREVFLKLIQVNGIGPKISISILSLGNVSDVVNAINNSDIYYLKQANNVSAKLAQQIIFDLKNKIKINNLNEHETNEINDARNALLSLSFKRSDIEPLLLEASKTCKTSKEYISYVTKYIGKMKA